MTRFFSRIKTAFLFPLMARIFFLAGAVTLVFNDMLHLAALAFNDVLHLATIESVTLVSLTIGVALFNKSKIESFLNNVLCRSVDRYDKHAI